MTNAIEQATTYAAVVANLTKRGVDVTKIDESVIRAHVVHGRKNGFFSSLIADNVVDFVNAQD